MKIRTMAAVAGAGLIIALGTPASAATPWKKAKVEHAVAPINKGTNAAIARDLKTIQTGSTTAGLKALAALGATALAYDTKASGIRTHATGKIGSQLGRSLVDAVGVSADAGNLANDTTKSEANTDATQLNKDLLALKKDEVH